MTIINGMFLTGITYRCAIHRVVRVGTTTLFKKA